MSLSIRIGNGAGVMGAFVDGDVAIVVVVVVDDDDDVGVVLVLVVVVVVIVGDTGGDDDDGMVNDCGENESNESTFNALC